MSMREAIESLVSRFADWVYIWRERRSRADGFSSSDASASEPKSPRPPIEWKKVGVVSGVRTLIDRRPGAALGVSAGVIGICVLLYLGAGRSIGGGASEYYFDAGTAEVFVTDAASIPPIAARSGVKLSDGAPAGVRVYMFACKNCEGAKLTPGYLERLAPKQHAALRSHDTSDLEGHPDFETFINAGWLVASPDKPQEWVSKSSPQALIIMDAPYARCGNEVVVPCRPK